MLRPTLCHPMLPRAWRKGIGEKRGGRCTTKARAVPTYHQSLLKSLLQTHPFLCPNILGCICQIPIPSAGRGCSRARTLGGLQLLLTLLPLISHPTARGDSKSFLCPPPPQ